MSSDFLVSKHQELMQEFDDIQCAVRDERLQCLKDRRFYSVAGAQWEGPLALQFENKPKFEVNKIHLSIIRIFNEYRNNRISVNFVPKDGSDNDKVSDTCNGLYRADEQNSCAEEAKDNAFEEGVGGGFGAWRLRADYENEYDDEDEKQRIYFEPIFDADSSVFFNLDAKRQDKSDAEKCFVLTSMSPRSYKKEYKDDPASWPKEIHQYEFDWATPDVVFVASCYEIEKKKEIVQIWENVLGEEETYYNYEFEDNKDLLNQLTAVGSKKIKEKKIKVKKVKKYVMSGSKILETPTYIAGCNIPIVPFYGKRWFVDNVERCMGHGRLATDSQRLKNMQLSKLGEISALSSVEKPLLFPEQVAGHQWMWEADNIQNYPYLLINPMKDINGQSILSVPIGYTKPPQIPQALAALLQITEQDMQDLLGTQQSQEEVTSNISGVAVELIHNRLDMQAFIYMSNMAKAEKRCGEIWLGMAKELYCEKGRKMKIIGSQNEVDSVELKKPIINESTGDKEYENDLSSCDLDVTVEVGPSSVSKRASTVRALTGMASITDDPETKQVLGAMAMMNMEGEGISEVRDFFRKKLLKMNVLKPTDEELQALTEEQANAIPDANSQYLMAAARQADADGMKAKADTVLTINKVEQTKAQTMKTLAEIDETQQAQALEVIDRFAQQPELKSIIKKEGE